jgi:hypothetical protein
MNRWRLVVAVAALMMSSTDIVSAMQNPQAVGSAEDSLAITTLSDDSAHTAAVGTEAQSEQRQDEQDDEGRGAVTVIAILLGVGLAVFYIVNYIGLK